ncbi:MAG: hypothetical protein OEP95_04910 [Myxococcales bacterium]|nr:hypothetical protein [Myxococcales bacterium]
MGLVFRAAFFLGGMLALTSLLPVASFAQPGAVGLANGVCRDDVDRFCADVKGQRGEVPKCLRAKSAELGPDCRQELEERDARFEMRLARIEEACPSDLEKFCAGEPDFEKAPCLRKHHADLSEGCRAAVQAPKTE